MKNKSAFKSKTIWINILIMIATLLAMDEFQDVAGELVGIGWIGIATNIINIAIRFMTATPISIASKKTSSDNLKQKYQSDDSYSKKAFQDEIDKENDGY